MSVGKLLTMTSCSENICTKSTEWMIPTTASCVTLSSRVSQPTDLITASYILRGEQRCFTAENVVTYSTVKLIIKNISSKIALVCS